MIVINLYFPQLGSEVKGAMLPARTNCEVTIGNEDLTANKDITHRD